MSRARWGRWELAVAGALVVVPFVHAIALWRAGWLPLGDNANIAIRSADVGTGSTPLVGMPSGIVGLVADSEAAHPGPLVFWSLGPWVRWFGPEPWALLLGSATVISLAVAAVLWSLRRAAGRRGFAVAALLTGLTLALTQFQLVQPLNPALALLPAIAASASAVAVGRGDRWALIPLVASASFALQADVVYVPVLLPVLAVAGVGWWRHRSAMAGERRPVWAALVVGLVCWSGPIVDVIVHRGGNLVETLRTSRAADLAPQGWGGASDAVRSTLHPVGWFLWAWLGAVPGDLITLSITVGWVALLAVLLVRRWPGRDGSFPALASVAAAALVGSAIGQAITPQSAGRTALYLSGVLVAGWLTTLVVGVALLDRWSPSPVVRRSVGGGAAVLVGSLLALRALTGSHFEPGNRAVAPLAAAAIDRLDPGEVALVSTGGPTSQTVLRGVGVELIAAGFRPCFSPDQDGYVGDRTCEAGPGIDRLVLTRPLVRSAPSSWVLLARSEGTDAATLERLRAEVAAQLRTAGIELTHQSSAYQIGQVLASAGAIDPSQVLDGGEALRRGEAARADPGSLSNLPDAQLATLAEEGIVRWTGSDGALWRRFLDATKEDELELWYVPAER